MYETRVHYYVATIVQMHSGCNIVCYHTSISEEHWIGYFRDANHAYVV